MKSLPSLCSVVGVAAFTALSRPTTTPAATPIANVAPPAVAPANPALPKAASFKFATQTLTVPAGFTVELVAGPPLVESSDLDRVR